MKKILLSLFAASAFAFVSCDNDDDNGGQNDSEVLGVYRIVSWNAPVAQDLNNDGTASGDLILEYDCYADWELVLHSNHTFTRTYNEVNVANGQLTCEAGESTTGTWVRDGQTLTLTNILGEDEVNNVYTFSADNQILTQTGPGQYPSIFEEVYVMDAGTVTVVYMKQDEGDI